MDSGKICLFILHLPNSLFLLPFGQKAVGEVSVTYSSGTSSASMSTQTDLADLTETSFGLQLLSLLKLYSMTRYVP